MSKKGKKKRKSVWIAEQRTYVGNSGASYQSFIVVATSKKKARKIVEARSVESIEWSYEDDFFLEGKTAVTRIDYSIFRAEVER